MHETDAHLTSDLREMKPRGGVIGGRAIPPPAVEHDDEGDGGEERRGDGDAAPRDRRGNHGVNHITRRVRDTSQRTLSGCTALVIFTACESQIWAGSACS
jgi:hypothetical protein